MHPRIHPIRHRQHRCTRCSEPNLSNVEPRGFFVRSKDTRSPPEDGKSWWRDEDRGEPCKVCGFCASIATAGVDNGGECGWMRASREIAWWWELGKFDADTICVDFSSFGVRDVGRVRAPGRPNRVVHVGCRVVGHSSRSFGRTPGDRCDQSAATR
jgi:hypothetical protein